MSGCIPTVANKCFHEELKLSFGKQDIIIDCKAKASNIFSKIISKNEIGVYGDYSVYIFYWHNLKEKNGKYKIKKLDRTFSEGIECMEEINLSEEEKDIEKLLYRSELELECKAFKDIKLIDNLVYTIRIIGKINILYLSEKEKNKEKKLEEKSSTSAVITMQSNVWYHRINKNYSINEILDMDEKTIKERFNKRE